MANAAFFNKARMTESLPMALAKGLAYQGTLSSRYTFCGVPFAFQMHSQLDQLHQALRKRVHHLLAGVVVGCVRTDAGLLAQRQHHCRAAVDGRGPGCPNWGAGSPSEGGQGRWPDAHWPRARVSGSSVAPEILLSQTAVTMAALPFFCWVRIQGAPRGHSTRRFGRGRSACGGKSH